MCPWLVSRSVGTYNTYSPVPCCQDYMPREHRISHRSSKLRTSKHPVSESVAKQPTQRHATIWVALLRGCVAAGMRCCGDALLRGDALQNAILRGCVPAGWRRRGWNDDCVAAWRENGCRQQLGGSRGLKLGGSHGLKRGGRQRSVASLSPLPLSSRHSFTCCCPRGKGTCPVLLEAWAHLPRCKRPLLHAPPA